MKTLILTAISASALLCCMFPAQDASDLEHKSLKGEFVIRDSIQDTEAAKKFYPVTSPFAGKMFVVKVEYIGKAPKWFGDNPRWIQSLEFPGKIKADTRFKGEVHYEPKVGFHFSCFSPVQFYLKEAEQASNGQPATRYPLPATRSKSKSKSKSKSEGTQNTNPEKEARSR